MLVTFRFWILHRHAQGGLYVYQVWVTSISFGCGIIWTGETYRNIPISKTVLLPVYFPEKYHILLSYILRQTHIFERLGIFGFWVIVARFVVKSLSFIVVKSYAIHRRLASRPCINLSRYPRTGTIDALLERLEPITHEEAARGLRSGLRLGPVGHIWYIWRDLMTSNGLSLHHYWMNSHWCHIYAIVST